MRLEKQIISLDYGILELCPVSIIKEGSGCSEAAPFHHGQVCTSFLLLLVYNLSQLVSTGLPNTVLVDILVPICKPRVI